LKIENYHLSLFAAGLYRATFIVSVSKFLSPQVVINLFFLKTEN